MIQILRIQIKIRIWTRSALHHCFPGWVRETKSKAFKRVIIEFLGLINRLESNNVLKNVNINIAGRSGFIKAEMFFITQPGFSENKSML